MLFGGQVQLDGAVIAAPGRDGVARVHQRAAEPAALAVDAVAERFIQPPQPQGQAYPQAGGVNPLTGQPW